MHSVWKGSCSYAATGTTVAPPIVSIFLQKMWSMGRVKERYLSFKNAGDQYLGRLIPGMKLFLPLHLFILILQVVMTQEK